MSKPKIIAFYLPQFHPIPENDEWWGRGFTEWTNVGKARPLFKGHVQPKVPADLGYYDLRLPEIREQQVELAREAGIYGFCYYHYWFGNGKQLLERPFNEVLESGSPDFPFMLCWANESWLRKQWNSSGKVIDSEVLIDQIYPGIEDIRNHFYKVLPAFKDSRYIKIDNKPLFMIYSPFLYDERLDFIHEWQRLAKENGIPEIIFIAQVRTQSERNSIDYINEGFKYINTERLREVWYEKKSLITRAFRKCNHKIFNKFTGAIDYSKACDKFINEEDLEEHYIPTLLPNWDHTPRSGRKGFVFRNSSPEAFKQHCLKMLDFYKEKPFLFLKSWNEWGEGNYMEPDLKYGKGYIEALHSVLRD